LFKTSGFYLPRCPSIFSDVWRFGEERLRGVERREETRGKENRR